MRRSRHIQVAALSILGMAACSSKHAASPDPCQAETYNDIACWNAVENHGYYSQNVFIYGNYPQPYMSYYQRYQAFKATGEVNRGAELDAYAWHGGASGVGGTSGGGTSGVGESTGSKASEGSVSRGGFGASAQGAGE